MASDRQPGEIASDRQPGEIASDPLISETGRLIFRGGKYFQREKNLLQFVLDDFFNPFSDFMLPYGTGISLYAFI